MGAIIDYYFAPISGYAYLGHQSLMALAAKAQATVVFKPLVIGKVFAASETTPPFAQSAPRKSYRIADQARWAMAKGLVMNEVPAHWPTDPVPACKTIIAAGALGADQDAISFGCLRAVWAEEKNIADTAVLEEVLTKAGADASTILTLAETTPIAAQVETITDAAIAAEVFGSPTYVLNGERYWGQDRLAFLEAVLMQEAA
ncbi:MAG: 2-hydroxychromene-2-carboxylate isomerase [Pseudomonadota bacterium]